MQKNQRWIILGFMTCMLVTTLCYGYFMKIAFGAEKPTELNEFLEKTGAGQISELRVEKESDSIETMETLFQQQQEEIEILNKKIEELQKAKDTNWIPLDSNQHNQSTCCMYKGVCLSECHCYKNENECTGKIWQNQNRHQLKCPNDCSNHGRCIDGICYCQGHDNTNLKSKEDRYFGLDCSIKAGPGQLIPSFVVVGTQKGGTTALFWNLAKHPQIMKPDIKESHFLDKNGDIGLQAYLESLLEEDEDRRIEMIKQSQAGKRIIVGEATPMYMVMCHAARTLYSLFPHIKVIMLLRDPVDRAYSNYIMKYRRANEKSDLSSFEHYIKEGKSGVQTCSNSTSGEVVWRYPCCAEPPLLNWGYSALVTRGFYAAQIEEFYKFFDEKQILVLDSSELLRKQKTVLNKVVSFLDLEPYDFHDMQTPPAGTHAQSLNLAIDEKTKTGLTQYYSKFNEKLYKLLGHDFDWNKK